MRRWADSDVEGVIGSLLRAGVALAAAVVLAGGAMYLARHGHDPVHYRIFRGEPTDLRDVSGIIHDALTPTARGVIQLGLLLLVATPVARVVFSVFAFALERDRLYVGVTLFVLAVLVFSLMGGRI